MATVPDLDPGHLPPAVRAALEDAVAKPTMGLDGVTGAAGIRFATTSWGDPADQPLLLVHGITSDAATWWRIGPALAAAGFAVTAIDQPGHGRTGGWRGRHRFRETAADLAAFIRAADLDRPELSVIGHSWGAMVVACLPAAGILPRRLVLFDAPAMPHSVMAAMVTSANDRPYRDVAEAAAALRAENPDWLDTDVEVKARSLVEMQPEAVRAVLLDNGDWDGGLAGATDGVARRVDIRVVRGDPDAGGLLPDEALPAFEALLGAGHVITIPGAAHAPQRLMPAELTAALLRALSA